jgi:hypothetical protein
MTVPRTFLIEVFKRHMIFDILIAAMPVENIKIESTFVLRSCAVDFVYVMKVL